MVEKQTLAGQDEKKPTAATRERGHCWFSFDLPQRFA
jgi:hypothetical protein